MQYGEKHSAFHNLIEAFFGADEDEPVDNKYGSFEIDLVGKGVGETLLVRSDTDYRNRKCFFCGKPGHLAKECRSAAYQKGIGKSVKGDDKKGTQNQEDAQTQKSSEKDKRETKCSQCGEVGHVAKEYRDKEIHKVSIAQNTKRVVVLHDDLVYNQEDRRKLRSSSKSSPPASC